VPWRATTAERVLEGALLDEALANRAAAAAMEGAVPNGENAFKIELGRRTLVRALLEVQAMEVA
jgi:xanthine dehydrogenase YagS FAD-binding subunit